ncbi:MAG: hypothetical protein AAFU61_07040, partial [Pseudomonadota bacterium]
PRMSTRVEDAPRPLRLLMLGHVLGFAALGGILAAAGPARAADGADASAGMPLTLISGGAQVGFTRAQFDPQQAEGRIEIVLGRHARDSAAELAEAGAGTLGVSVCGAAAVTGAEVSGGVIRLPNLDPARAEALLDQLETGCDAPS